MPLKYCQNSKPLLQAVFMEEKMRFIIPIMLLLFLAMPANAEFVGPGVNSSGKGGGFTGPVSGAMADNVASARNLPDDAPVLLTGNIVSQLAGSRKKYVFKDNTGEIVVEIAPKVFKGLRITPANTVRLSGKMDQDFGQEPEVEVNNLALIN